MANIVEFGKVQQFFAQIFEQFTRAVNFLFTIPGLVLTSIFGVVTAGAHAIQFLTSDGFLQSTVISYANSAFEEGSLLLQAHMTPSFGEGYGLVQSLLYTVNADGFAKCVIQLPIWIVGISFFVATWVVDTLFPVLVIFLVYKIGYKILVAILPKGWTPNLLIDIPSYEEFSVEKGNVEVFG